MKFSKVLFVTVIVFFTTYCGNAFSDWDDRMAYFVANPAPPGSTMMVGDSITEVWTHSKGFPINWINRGISGDTSLGVIKRLAQHLADKPAVVYILIGINDCFRSTPLDLLVNYEKILRICKTYPDIKFNVISILPIYINRVPNNHGYRVQNSSIESINSKIKALCQQTGIKFIDVYPSFVNNSKPTSLYYDNLHPSDLGYSILLREIKANALPDTLLHDLSG